MELHIEHSKLAPARAIIDRRKMAFTLPECLIATALVAVSVAALAGTLDAVYKQERYIADDARALASARQLMEEVSALPITASTAGDVTLSSMNNYTDEVTLTSTSNSPIQASLLNPNSAEAIVPAGADTTKQNVVTSVAVRPMKMTRSVSILSSSVPVAGRTVTGGKLAQISVDVRMPNGQTIKVRRLVADADKAGGSR